MGLRELIGKVLEKNIGEFEKEYAQVLRSVFSEMSVEQGEPNREIIEQELEKMEGKGQALKKADGQSANAINW